MIKKSKMEGIKEAAVVTYFKVVALHPSDIGEKWEYNRMVHIYL
jgi:hypothetical protein